MKVNMDIIEIYENILSGKLKRFPMHTWDIDNDGFRTFKIILRYLLLEKLKYNREEILKLNRTFFKKYKLDGAIKTLFEASIFEVVNYCFPELNIKPWELSKATNKLWYDKKQRKAAIRWLVLEKMKWSKEEFIKKFDTKLLNEYGLISLIQYEDRIGELVEYSFPEWNISAKEYDKIRYQKNGDRLSKFFRDVNNKENLRLKNRHLMKIDKETAEKIRKEYAEKEKTIKELSESYSLSPRQVSRIVKNESWIYS